VARAPRAVGRQPRLPKAGTLNLLIINLIQLQSSLMQKNSCRTRQNTSFKKNQVKIGPFLTKLERFEKFAKTWKKFEKSTLAHL
jgi:hypothetical protein